MASCVQSMLAMVLQSMRKEGNLKANSFFQKSLLDSWIANANGWMDLDLTPMRVSISQNGTPSSSYWFFSFRFSFGHDLLRYSFGQFVSFSTLWFGHACMFVCFGLLCLFR